MRFPEFSGKWEKFRVSDFIEFFPTNSLSWDQLEYRGAGLLNLHYGMIHNGLPVQVDASKNALPSIKEDFYPKKYTLCKEGDIAFADASEDTNDVGKAIEFNNCAGKSIVCGLHTIHGRDRFGLTSIGFKGYLFSSKVYHDQIKSIAQGTKVFSIKASNFDEVILGLPKNEEQKKISSLLMAIDDRIKTQSKIIEEQETLLRSLRHKIYSRVQAQSQCTIADVLCYEQPTKYLVTDTDYTDDDSQVPVLTANKAFILGYTTENFGIYDKGPCIILDDFTLDCKYVDFKFKVKSSAIKILRAKAKTNLRFIFEYFRFLELNTTEHRRHYIAEIEPMSILLPSNEEIDRIARLFTALDERLETARKELKILESQKMYMLQKMFI